jgi:Transposase.
MVILSWKCEGVILLDVMQRGTTINSDVYVITLKK